MQTSLMIIDDFLDNPFDLRNAALQQDYPHLEEKTVFPGRNSVTRMLVDGMDQQISRLVGESLTPKIAGHGHGRCRIALEGDTGTGNVHIDDSHWSGILYLSLPEHCQGGTDFFRHKRTDMERAPIYPEDLEKLGYENYSDIWDDVLNPDTNNEDAWERTMRVPMRFNRLILLRPWLYHTAGPGFGESLENGRLVYLLFFDQAGL